MSIFQYKVLSHASKQNCNLYMVGGREPAYEEVQMSDFEDEDF